MTRYNPGRVSRGDMLSMEDVLEILRIPLVGVIPEDQSVLRASNRVSLSFWMPSQTPVRRTTIPFTACWGRTPIPLH